MISTHSMTLVRQQHTLLDRLSVDFPAGQVTAILGPNGAGKSTLLRCLAGALMPNEGEVRFAGQRLSAMAPLELARRRAVLSQANSLTFPFKAREVVMLGRHPHSAGHEQTIDKEIVCAALNEVEAWHLCDQAMTTLSGGERQRVHLARALAQLWGADKPVLLLDEPTAALDLRHQHSVLGIARRWSEKHEATVVCILHEPRLARYYADTALLLRAGQKVASGPVSQVLSRDALMHLFDLSALMYERHFSPVPEESHAQAAGEPILR